MSSLLSLYRSAFSNMDRNTWILSIGTFINRSGAMVLLFTSLYLTDELHFSLAEAGVIMSFYGIGSVLGAYAGGWLTDRRNFYDIMVFSLISSGIVLLLLLIVTSKFYLSVVILVYAFANDMFRPANAAAIAAYSDSENRTRSVSLIRLAINLGFSVGPAAGGFVALYLGYRWLFVIDAVTSILAAVLLMVYLPRPALEKNRGEGIVLNDSNTSAYRDYAYLFFIFLVTLYAISFFQLFVSVPQYLSKECSYREDAIGLLLALNGLLVVLIEMPLVAVLEKKKGIFNFIIAGSFFVSVAFAILYAGGGLLVWVIVYTIVITFSEMLAMPFMMNHSLSRPKKERQGQYSALYSIAWGFGFILAPLAGPGIADHYGFDLMFYFFIVLGIITALGFGFLSRRINFNLNAKD
ncbi:MAG: MFS transporter [Bacteroidetes bacterium]|nr:MAG: MFS transporter [Bacteroidota bacterium]